MPNPTTFSPIVSLDPATPLVPKPLIADILRDARYCIPGSVFLVESVERRVPIPDSGRHRPRRAVRLLLGDGELCIQAFVRAEIHCVVDGGSVYEGCYVRLDRFEVGGVVYLVVGDMVTVGWNEEYLGVLRREGEADRGESLGGEGEEQGGVCVGSGQEEEEYDDDEDEELMQLLMADEETGKVAAVKTADQIHATKNVGANRPKPPTHSDPDELDYISDSDSAFETAAVSAERATQRRVLIAAPDPRQELQAAIIKQNQALPHPKPKPPQPISKPRPWLPSDATQPLKLTPLSSIPTLPYRQNWMVNVLAVVTSLSTVEPSHIGPSFQQRTARLADMSTPKQVHLTVYLDPEAFTPLVGGVVLLLGVKNHLFEGGSLRKYVSDGLRGGGCWWVQGGIEGLGWCRGEVGRLRAWWGSQLEGEEGSK
ncbi:hypothetical protein C8A00DRAFT_46281 [Chaetomidium leptoderma]|uniref:Uncharacterized protein n=1 Tax=Chaetomidium leptoderma TaxID=669021 RepID=A0AAN6ZSK1_9PEZI|nr:hypothetical protein C8A00DRAFT_46281 [Chaetomidium leptoderma]